MTLFRHATRERSERTRRIYAAHELARTAVDFLAALLFLAGSILFLFPATEAPAVWLFILGSLCFATKPTIKLLRELRMARAGDVDDLAQREEGAD